MLCMLEGVTLWHDMCQEILDLGVGEWVGYFLCMLVRSMTPQECSLKLYQECSLNIELDVLSWMWPQTKANPKRNTGFSCEGYINGFFQWGRTSGRPFIDFLNYKFEWLCLLCAIYRAYWRQFGDWCVLTNLIMYLTASGWWSRGPFATMRSTVFALWTSLLGSWFHIYFEPSSWYHHLFRCFNLQNRKVRSASHQSVLGIPTNYF